MRHSLLRVSRFFAAPSKRGVLLLSRSSFCSCSSSSRSSLVAVTQLSSTADIEGNVKQAEIVVNEAAHCGVSLVCLPEMFAVVAESGKKSSDYTTHECSAKNPLLKPYLEMAAANNVWLSLGGFPIRCGEKGEDCEMVTNCHLIVDNEGAIRARYDKIHLFDIDMPGGVQLKESATARGGERTVVCQSPAGVLGLSVCYDLRFPYLYNNLRRTGGAQLLLVPATFAFATGCDHWEVLLRARAIENQCFVIAAAQNGQLNAKRNSWGHAMVVDPWGTVVAQCSPKDAKPTFAVANINLDVIDTVQSILPIEEHEKIHFQDFDTVKM